MARGTICSVQTTADHYFAPMRMSLLKYPFPYKAWLTMANDPDNTLIDDWNELDAFIWHELKLPFADSLFIRSFNKNLPQQVNLVDHPQIALGHQHDTIHTWGDYMHAGRRGFDREDAIESVELLKQASIEPRVWIDHASFAGNMIHGTNKGSVPALLDSSGHTYTNFVYSLDLARQAGVRYVWNGEVTSVIGQDRAIGLSEHASNLRSAARYIASKAPIAKLKHLVSDNRQYYPHRFADGSSMYCFRRYGTWQHADIDGLAEILSPGKIHRLISVGGTSVAYSHLGKRMAGRHSEKQHIPNTTRAALKNVAEFYAQKQLKVSATSTLLDYLVLRDHIVLNSQNRTIEWKPDGIRFQQLDADELKGHSFSFAISGGNASDVEILIQGVQVDAAKENQGNILTIYF